MARDDDDHNDNDDDTCGREVEKKKRCMLPFKCISFTPYKEKGQISFHISKFYVSGSLFLFSLL